MKAQVNEYTSNYNYTTEHLMTELHYIASDD